MLTLAWFITTLAHAQVSLTVTVCVPYKGRHATVRVVIEVLVPVRLHMEVRYGDAGAGAVVGRVRNGECA